MERAKFDRYASPACVVNSLPSCHRAVVSIRRSVRACRDPNDDKFLEVAVNGKADMLVSGDADLLALDPFEGIPIITPVDYLAKIGR